MLRLITVAALLLAAAPVTAKPVVIGYLPTFKDYHSTLATVDMSELTHINIAFANPDPNGNFIDRDHMSCSDSYAGGMTSTQDIRDIVAAAHKKGVKVLLSLGGGEIPSCAGDWIQLLSAQNRPKLVENLLKTAQNLHLDGVDIDLEWSVLTAIDNAAEYTPFVADLAAGLHARHQLLTCATASSPGGMVPLDSLPYFDFINIMSYDGVGPTWGEPGGENASYQMAVDDLATWQARGVPENRLVLGVPFYGQGFGDYKNGNDYNHILQKFGAQAAEYDVQGQRCGGCSYVSYNGRPTLRAKAKLAAGQAGGIMIWELTSDVPGPDSLLDAVHDSLVNP